MTLTGSRPITLSSISTAEIQPQQYKGDSNMINEPTAEQLAKVPGLYETEHISIQDKIIYAHFFIGDSHWFLTEYDKQGLAFGFCILNGNFEMAEWGFFSMEELRTINIFGVFQVEYDVLWEPKSAKDVELIQRGRGVWADPRDGGYWQWHTLQS
jgi:hypothetical protein